MDFGGIVIVAAAFTMFGTIPLLVARQAAMMQTREDDRYSQRLRLLEDACEQNGAACERSSGAILALPRAHPDACGGDMTDHSFSHRELRVERRALESVHEIARLRARRAARLSSEAAAGRRRLLLSAACALATALVGILALLASLAWVWILIPAGLLALALTASRLAAVRSHSADLAERELLAELRECAGKAPAPRPRGAASDAGADSGSRSEVEATTVAAGDASVSAVSIPVEGGESESVESVTEPQVSDETSALVTEGAAQTEEDGVKPVAQAPCVEAEEACAESAPIEGHTWSLVPVPAPSYAMRGRVSGRVVHADTDLRGIPRVDALVPARPVSAGVLHDARSTEEVAAGAACAFDLDAVLEARRAQ